LKRRSIGCLKSTVKRGAVTGRKGRPEAQAGFGLAAQGRGWLRSDIMQSMATETTDLSEREIEILRLVATGASNKEIAQQLYISPNTVKVHLRNVFSKIGVVSRTEATLYAIRNGLVTAPVVSGLESPVDSPPIAEEVASPVVSPHGRLRRVLAVALVSLVAIALFSAAGMAVARRFLPAASTSDPTAPVPERWQQRADLPLARAGMAGAVYENTIFIIAGETAEGVSDRVEAYSPESDRWESRAPKPLPVADVHAALIGEKIYVPGGRMANGKPTTALEVYDPREDRWETKTPLPTPLSNYALAAYEGSLYLFGGWDGSNYLDTVFSYNSDQDTWEKMSSMPSPRAGAGVVVMTGKIYVLGGFDGEHALDENQLYFPSRDGRGDNPWESRKPLPEPRYGMGTVGIADNIYVIGGITGRSNSSEILFYSNTEDIWQRMTLENTFHVEYPSLIAFQTELILVGGKDEDQYFDELFSYTAVYYIHMPVIQ
jgi:DNA-binding CsgD family transcriptional regulator/N-acetylneuraminic acid mutarotase